MSRQSNRLLWQRLRCEVVLPSCWLWLRALATCPDASYGYTIEDGLQADMTCVRNHGEGFATHAQLLKSTPARSHVMACPCPRPSTPTDTPRLPKPSIHPVNAGAWAPASRREAGPRRSQARHVPGPTLSMLEHRPLHPEVRLGRASLKQGTFRGPP